MNILYSQSLMYVTIDILNSMVNTMKKIIKTNYVNEKHVGEVFGNLKVVKVLNSTWVTCKCLVCGGLSEKRMFTVKDDLPISCSFKCKRVTHAAPHIGKIYSILKVLRLDDSQTKGATKVMCKCQKCGWVSSKTLNNVLSHKYTRCSKGCGKEIIIQPPPTHGLRNHRLYSIHRSMMNRCYNDEDKSYCNYGGRDIQVSSDWHDVANFIDDMYPTYKEGLSIDRINNDGHYHIDNCRWATKKQQVNNARSNVILDTPDGEMTLAQAAEKYNLTRSALTYRNQRGWTGEKLVRPIFNKVDK